MSDNPFRGILMPVGRGGRPQMDFQIAPEGPLGVPLPAPAPAPPPMPQPAFEEGEPAPSDYDTSQRPFGPMLLPRGSEISGLWEAVAQALDPAIEAYQGLTAEGEPLSSAVTDALKRDWRGLRDDFGGENIPSEGELNPHSMELARSILRRRKMHQTGRNPNDVYLPPMGER